MVDGPRQIIIGSKPLHVYVAAVRTVIENESTHICLSGRGKSIRTVVDVAEICRRRHGTIASGLPEGIHIVSVNTDTEQLSRDDGGTSSVSVLRIIMDVGISDGEE